MGSTEPEIPKSVEEADRLYDERTDSHYRVVAVSNTGLTLRRNGSEYYVPHEAFTEWYDPDHVTHNDKIPADQQESPTSREPSDETSVTMVSQVMDAAKRDEDVYVRRQALRDAKRHGTGEYVPVVVEKVWTQGVARVHSRRTRRTYLVDLDDVKLSLSV